MDGVSFEVVLSTWLLVHLPVVVLVVVSVEDIVEVVVGL